MFKLWKSWTEMDLFPLVCLCVLTWSRGTFAGPDGPLITTITVEEDDDVVLPCSFSTSDIRNKYFDWKKDAHKNVFSYQSGSHYNNGVIGQDQDFKGRVSHFPDRLQSGNASIRINPVKVSDKGTYSCDFPSDGGIQSHIELVVECILRDRTSENIPGSCPQPSVTARKTDEGFLLKCKVKHGSPEPEVKWQDSDGNTVPSKDPQISKNGDYSDIILLAAVTEEGDYQCVVKQTQICHQVYSKLFLWQSSGSQNSRDGVSQTLLGFIILVLILVIIVLLILLIIVIILVVFVKTGRVTLNFRNGSERPRTGEIKELNSNRSDL